MTDAEVLVEAYSGYRFGERPRAFTWQGRRYQVLDVERRWRTPGGIWFIVTTAANSENAGLRAGGEHRGVERWKLTYDEVRHVWHVRRIDQRG